MITVAALYVDREGPYSTMPNVDCWDSSRDARTYDGPHPVVAHPPCQLWVNFAALNFKRYGGEHNRPGNDGKCFASALRNVRAYGGVLEHPANSLAFRAHSLCRPQSGRGWCYLGDNEWTCEVYQSAYGHRARKITWLYYVGKSDPPQLNWQQTPGTHQIGWFDRIKPTLNKKEASRTPVAFAETLVSLARLSRESDHRPAALRSSPGIAG